MKDIWLPSGTGKIRILPTPTYANTFHIDWVIGKRGRRREKIKRIYGDRRIHTK
jgi:hypothetical protein